MANRLAIVGGTIVTPENAIESGVVLCEDGKIKSAGSSDEVEPESDSRIIDGRGKVIMPGFIDTHFHGSGGDDVTTGGREGIRRISRALLKFGTTAYLPSTVAARHETLLRSIEEVRAAETEDQDSPEAAEILGIHLEGPYINLKFKGAQPEWGIRDPDYDQCRELLAAGRIKIMTLAPELLGDFDPHDSELEEAADQVGRHRGVAVHLMDERADLLDGELADALLEHLFVFGEDGQRGGRQGFTCGGHGASGEVGVAGGGMISDDARNGAGPCSWRC